jgi:hypothetical protein
MNVIFYKKCLRRLKTEYDLLTTRYPTYNRASIPTEDRRRMAGLKRRIARLELWKVTEWENKQ